MVQSLDAGEGSESRSGDSAAPESPVPDPGASGLDAGSEASGPQRGFDVGERVRLAQALGYLKTADPMPMLRPPDLVSSEEVGVVVEIRARDQVAVRFRRGTFLLLTRDLSPALQQG